MKKVFKILGFIFLLILIALVAIPYFYKDEIGAFIKEDINKNFNAVIDYDAVSLSLFADFPNLNVSIDNITIDGIGDFKDNNLATIKNLDLSLNAKKVFIDKELVIKKIKVDALNLDLLVDKNNKENYHILKENTATTDSVQTSFELNIKEYELSNSDISYRNLANGMTLKFENINHSGAGQITDKAYNLTTNSTIEKVDIDYDVHYVNEALVRLKSNILIEEDYTKYTLQDNELAINDLPVTLSKSIVALKGDDIILDIAFETAQNQLKELMSLIPNVYLTSVEDVEANGQSSLSGFVKGVYNAYSYPAYGFDLKVVDGYVKYPDLPESLEHVNLVAKVAFKGGKNLNNTIINLPKIHFSIGDNTADGNLRIQNPLTDPLINTHFKSVLDLEKLKNAVKIPGLKKLKGLLNTDFNLQGKLSSIEKKQYDKFKASGFLNLSDFNIQSDSIPYDIDISKANMDITPRALKMKNLQAIIGENDFSIQGDITNYLAYFLKKDEILKANFKMHSRFVNLNDFLTGENESTDEEIKESGIIKIPKNIEINFTADADNLKYKDLGVKEVTGTLQIKDEKATLTAVLLKTLDGQIKLNGSYDTSLEKAISSFDMDLQNLSIIKSANSFSAFQAFAPILEKIQGDFFSSLKMDVLLDNQMNPILSTVKANGDFNTNSIELQGINIVKKIASILKIDALNNPNIDRIKARFSIDNGTMTVKPFTFKLNNITSALKGSVNLDKQIDFVLSLDIPKKMLGSNPNQLLEGIVGKLSDLGLKSDLGDIIKMNFSIKGDYNNPKILPAIAGYEGETVGEIIKDVIEDKVDEVVDEAVDTAREEAKLQAAKLMAKAQQQADSLVSKAQQLSTRINVEAKAQGDKLISSANNPFKKIAAQAAAKKINQEAEKKGNKLVEKAQEKADTLLSKAQLKADEILQTAIKKES